MWKIWPKMKVMTWSEKVMISCHSYQSIHIVDLNTSHAFHCYSLSLSKAFAEKQLVTFQDQRWLRGHEEASLAAFFRSRVSISPVTPQCLKVLRMVFVQKRHFSSFHRWLTYNGRDRKIDLTLGHQCKNFQIYIFYSQCYCYQYLKVSRRSFGRCNYDEYWNVFWGEIT